MTTSDSPAPTAAVLVIGNEILSGRTRDANLGAIAEALGAIGIRLREARVVADAEADIVAALDALRARYDHVFTTGGIGPTHDDITAASVAKAFGVDLERHPEAVRRLQAHYPPEKLNQARLRMAMVPAGATLIDNPISAAPGFRIGNVFVLAGVPDVMRAMLEGVLPQLRSGPPVLSRIVTCDLGEGTIADGLAAIQARHPAVEIGSYPYFRLGAFGVSLVVRGTDAALIAAAAEEIAALIRDLGGMPRITEGA